MSILDSLREPAAGRRTPPKRVMRPGGAISSTVPPPVSPSPTETDFGLAHVATSHIATALTIRRTEERLLELFSEGRLSGTVHTCIGQEWSAVAIGTALRDGDYLFSNHRGHGHYLARTSDVDGLMAEVMGRDNGVCGGRGGSQHLCRDGFFSNGIQGGISPVAAGLAMGCRLRRTERIAAVCIGDGTFGEGVVYETLNLASKWRLPLLILVEDNGIAQSTPQQTTLAGTIEGRARAFDIACYSSDTWHPAELIKTAQEVAGWVRHHRRPAMLHVRTFRLKAHSKGDDDRPAEVVQEYARRDILNHIFENPTPAIRDILDGIEARLDYAVTRAEQSPVTRHVPLEQEKGQEKGSGVFFDEPFEDVRIVDGIRSALSDAMGNDPRILILGEDVADPYGGAFKVTAGLSTRYPDRVVNTPISEAAIVGVGTGLAIDGWRPIVEIMFGDFVLLAADQWVNHAAKFAWMYNEQVQVPLIVRTPMGGYRGYGPTHSQSLEKHLLGVPGTAVWAMHHRHCPHKFYEALLQSVSGPTLVIENKLLYTRRASAEVPPGWSLETYRPTAGGSMRAMSTMTRLQPPRQPDLTILAYGAMAPLAEAAAVHLWDEEDLACELIFPMQLHPLTVEPVFESISRTGHLLVIEESQGFAGWGSEVIAQTEEERAFSGCSSCPKLSPQAQPDIRIGRVHARSCPIPASRSAELDVLPSEAEIIDAAIALIAG